MKFLVILISLIINYVWLKDIDRFNDGWFFRFRERAEKLVDKLGKSLPVTWLFGLLIIYAVPLTVLVVLLLVVNDRAFGIPMMLLHILVLLVALDRTQPGQLAKDFLSHWYSENLSACANWVEQELAVPAGLKLDSEEALGRFFGKQLTYRCFERMFVMFFWYVLAGPLAVLVAYISYQLRDSHRQDQSPDEVDFIKLVIALIEWIPLRLLAVTFSLAGNFVQCFDRVKQSFWSFGKDADTAEMLYGYACCALSGMVIDDLVDSTQADRPEEETPQVRERRRQGMEIEALQALLERSQAIWLALLALLTIFAIP